MATDPRQTSDKLMIYEVRDYCTALLNLDGELISQNVGTRLVVGSRRRALSLTEMPTFARLYGERRRSLRKKQA